MADVTTVAAHDEHRPRRGCPNTKLAMWLFLASECLLFGALITTYLLYRGRASERPVPAATSSTSRYTSVSSFVLLASSLTMVLALTRPPSSATTRGCALWLIATAMLGLTFVGGQVYEFTASTSEGLHARRRTCSGRRSTCSPGSTGSTSRSAS